MDYYILVYLLEHLEMQLQYLHWFLFSNLKQQSNFGFDIVFHYWCLNICFILIYAVLVVLFLSILSMLWFIGRIGGVDCISMWFEPNLELYIRVTLRQIQLIWVVIFIFNKKWVLLVHLSILESFWKDFVVKCARQVDKKLGFFSQLLYATSNEKFACKPNLLLEFFLGEFLNLTDMKLTFYDILQLTYQYGRFSGWI